MMNASMRGALAAALIAMSGAASAAYKCKDANGKISYSEQPCQGAATQTRIKTDADAREDFVRKLQALAKQEVMWDAPTLEKTLGVRLNEVSAMNHGVTTYSFATLPAGAPILGSRVMLPTGENSYTGGSMELRLDPKRCVSPNMISLVFGAGADLNPEHGFNYVVTAGGYRTEISGIYRSDYTVVMDRAVARSASRCAEHMTLRQVATQPRNTGGRRR